jgi:hypothetical protein
MGGAGNDRGESGSAERVLHEAQRRLEPAGWGVTLHTTPAGFQIHLEHPVSTSHAMAFGREHTTEDHLAFLERNLSQREFDVVEKRPSETPHASLMQRIRQSVAAHPAWPDDVVPMFARVLRSEALLTDAEAVWLEGAGVPWRE